MTDKDIKDYCKNCDVEPPAMKFKCPECEHNPDKVMIYGVDISRCDNFRNGWCHPDTGVCYKCDTNCSYAAFHFKEQLARKTQEYNELLKQHKELEDRVNRMIKEKYNLARGTLLVIPINELPTSYYIYTDKNSK